MPRTVLLAPLSARIAMIGSFEGDHVLCGRLSEADVAAVNSHLIHNAGEFIYSRTANFAYSPDGKTVSYGLP